MKPKELDSRITSGRFRVGVKHSLEYKKLVDELGDEFKEQIYNALAFEDAEMVKELKKFKVALV